MRKNKNSNIRTLVLIILAYILLLGIFILGLGIALNKGMVLDDKIIPLLVGLFVISFGLLIIFFGRKTARKPKQPINNFESMIDEWIGKQRAQ